MQRIAMLSIQDDRPRRGGYFGAVKGKNNTTAVVLFMPQGLQLCIISELEYDTTPTHSYFWPQLHCIYQN